MYIYTFLVQVLRAFYLAGLRLLLDTAPHTVHYTESINLKHEEPFNHMVGPDLLIQRCKYDQH